MTSAELSAILKRFNPVTAATEVINDTAEDYLELNRKQMTEGKRKTGGKIMDSPGRPYASIGYSVRKNALNPLAGAGNPDLKLTGAFHRSLAMEVQAADIIIEASDSKAPWLEDHYGVTIYGLNDKNQERYNTESFLPAYQAEVTRQTGLVFR